MSENKEAAQDTTNAATQTTEATANTEAATQNAAPAEADASKQESGAKSEGSEKVVPEKYELKLPEGSKLDPGILEKTMLFAKEKGLSQEDAQALIDRDHATVSAFEEQSQNQLKQLNDKDWKNELFEDKDFGGAQFEESGHLAAKAAETWFGAEFADELKAMNLNHHPKLFRGLVRIARAMADDKLVQPGHARGEKSVEEMLYGSTN